MLRMRAALIIAPALLVAAAALAQTPTGHTVLRETGLEKAPTSSAALSFAEPQVLPTRLAAQVTVVYAPFTISNNSAAMQNYQWSLGAARTGRRSSGLSGRTVSGSITMAPGAEVTMDPALRLSCAGGQIRVTVRLASPAESIYFLANCPDPPNPEK